MYLWVLLCLTKTDSLQDRAPNYAHDRCSAKLDVCTYFDCLSFRNFTCKIVQLYNKLLQVLQRHNLLLSFPAKSRPDVKHTNNCIKLLIYFLCFLLISRCTAAAHRSASTTASSISIIKSGCRRLCIEAWEMSSRKSAITKVTDRFIYNLACIINLREISQGRLCKGASRAASTFFFHSRYLFEHFSACLFIAFSSSTV